jgi:hypothetical protein
MALQPKPLRQAHVEECYDGRLHEEGKNANRCHEDEVHGKGLQITYHDADAALVRFRRLTRIYRFKPADVGRGTFPASAALRAAKRDADGAVR